MKTILLTQGKFATVDDGDFEFLSQWKWRIGNTKYAVRWSARPNRKQLLMHRLVLERMGFSNFKEVDHADGNELNNTRSNLRPASRSENGCNKRIQSNNTSGFKGITMVDRPLPWRSNITRNKKTVFLGYFSSAVEAASAYDIAAKQIHGEYAKTNQLLGRLA
jgi:hypothetical protein